MSYERKKICATCKRGEIELAVLKKKLKSCSTCHIAQYCSIECQKTDYSDEHKGWCTKSYKMFTDLRPKIEDALKSKGHDVNRSVLKDFYDDNDAVFQYCDRNPWFDPDIWLPIFKLGIFHPVGPTFQGFKFCNGLAPKMMGEISRRAQSYQGMEKTLDAYLKVILQLQPYHLYLRALIPLIMIELGKDDDAYNFIKFWLINTPKNCDFVTSEDGTFPNLPFIEVTMQGQDKNEDILEVLGVGSERPYFIYVTFYIILAIIKKNNFDATKDVKQKEHFIKYLHYIKKHYKGLVKNGLTQTELSFPFGRSNTPIPVSFGLKGDRWNALDGTRTMARDFFNNFMCDLNFYLDRAGGMKGSMLRHL